LRRRRPLVRGRGMVRGQRLLPAEKKSLFSIIRRVLYSVRRAALAMLMHTPSPLAVSKSYFFSSHPFSGVRLYYKYRKRDQSATYYSCEKTRLAVYITSRIMPLCVKLEVIYRTNQTYSRRLGTHSPAAVRRHRLILTEIDCLYGVNSLPPTISIWAAYCHCVLYSVLYNL